MEAEVKHPVPWSSYSATTSAIPLPSQTVPDDALDSFRQPTEWCDAKNPHIVSLAAQIRAAHKDPREIAVACFYTVRDQILYRVGRWTVSASQTLNQREGSCTSKANLLVALLRACGLSAAYGVLKVDGPRYMGPAAIPMFRRYIAKISTHVYAGVYLGRWIRIDPSDDKALCENATPFRQPSLVEWDGVRDANLGLLPEHVLSDSFPLASIDHVIRRKPKNATGLRLTLANDFVRFVRNNRRPVENERELETLFRRHLLRHKPWLLVLYELKCRYDELQRTRLPNRRARKQIDKLS